MSVFLGLYTNLVVRHEFSFCPTVFAGLIGSS